MEKFIAELKSVPLAGSDEVFYPGEIEARNDARYRKEGLTLPADTVSDLAKIAGRCGLSFNVDG
jgi:LDH2 family malate/lactate/ureidoglycolate dehydrogenase